MLKVLKNMNRHYEYMNMYECYTREAIIKL